MTSASKKQHGRIFGVVNLVMAGLIVLLYGALLLANQDVVEKNGTVANKEEIRHFSKWHLGGFTECRLRIAGGDQIRVGSSLCSSLEAQWPIRYEYSDSLDMAFSANSREFSWSFFRLWVIFGALAGVAPLFVKALWRDGSGLLAIVQIYMLGYAAEWMGLLWL